jgi:hypothetical protein
LQFQIHCRIVRMKSERGGTDLPRYWITLDRETIWDYPGQFVTPGGTRRSDGGIIRGYPYSTDISAISELIREYIDTPVADLLTHRFENDHWGLANILRAADRRIGQRHWSALKRKTHNEAALKVLASRAPLREKAVDPTQGAGLRSRVKSLKSKEDSNRRPNSR